MKLMWQFLAKVLRLNLVCFFTSGLIAGCTELYSDPIKVGVLHAQTGAMAVSEIPVIDATLMAIDEINQAGGVMGRRLEAVVVDTQSNDQRAAMLSKQLIEKDKVQVVFGCWTSSCRKSVKPIFEKHSHLLLYPVQYEGLEISESIIYLGSVPNQQLMPGTLWLERNFGSRILLIASDYVFPKVANKLISTQLNALKSNVAGEYYYPLGHKDFSDLPKLIKKHNVTAIINTLNGDSNNALFKVITSENISTPVLSFSLSAQEIKSLKISKKNNIYAADSYFQSISSNSNQAFKDRVYKRYGEGSTISAPMVTAYNGVNLWAQAVTRLKTDSPSRVRYGIQGEMVAGPSGEVRISVLNNHVWTPFYIAKLKTNNTFEIIKTINKPIRPLPFPSYGNKQAWFDYLESLYLGWDGSWSNKQASHPSVRVIE
mgnify:CR=1 FL=1